MARGDFAKAFSQHRKDGGVLSRKEFAEKWKLEHPKPVKATKPKSVEYGLAEEQTREDEIRKDLGVVFDVDEVMRE